MQEDEDESFRLHLVDIGSPMKKRTGRYESSPLASDL